LEPLVDPEEMAVLDVVVAAAVQPSLVMPLA
jgi:hypothetical protein